jgi:hypothetical protein
MSLSDHPDRKHVPSNRRRAVGASSKNWSDSQKIEAVTTYLALGNLVLTSNVLKIPEMTLRAWKQTQWWKEIVDDLASQEDLQLSSRLKRIIESTLSATEDRIMNGNFIYDNKSGQLVRKPVDMKDLHKVTVDLIDKRAVLDNKQPNSVPLEQIESKLEKLAQKFAEIASGVRPIEVTDVIMGDFEEVEPIEEHTYVPDN